MYATIINNTTADHSRFNSEIIETITEMCSKLIIPTDQYKPVWCAADSTIPYEVTITDLEDGIRFYITGSSFYYGSINVYEKTIGLTKWYQEKKHIEITNTIDTISKVVAWMIKQHALCLPFEWVIKYGNYVSPIWYLKQKQIPPSNYKQKIANKFSDYLIGSHVYDKTYPHLGYYYEQRFYCF